MVFVTYLEKEELPHHVLEAQKQLAGKIVWEWTAPQPIPAWGTHCSFVFAWFRSTREFDHNLIRRFVVNVCRKVGVYKGGQG